MLRSGQAHALPLPPLPATPCALPGADDPRLAAEHAYVLLTEGDRLLSPELIGLLRRLSVPVLWKPFTPAALLDTVAHARLRLAAGQLLR